MLAVLISDIHYDMQSKDLADKSLRQAIDYGTRHDIPVIIAGDLHDTKANLRGECVKMMRDTLKTAKTPVYLLVGNHDKINEKSQEHSLEFLREIVTIIDKPTMVLNCHLLPYYSDVSALRSYLKTAKGTVIMHQGLERSDMGEYIQDKTAVTYDDVSHLRVIAGHYHPRQHINTGAGNHWDFIGNPYTRTFGEAKDPEKGFQVLHTDGSLTFVPTNLRKHVIIECGPDLDISLNYKDNDLIWVKIKGAKASLTGITRKDVERALGRPSFKLDFYPTDTVVAPPVSAPKGSIFDDIIDRTNIAIDQKTRLKALWRDLDEGTNS